MKVQRNIRALLVEPNELPKEVFIKNSLEAKQKLDKQKEKQAKQDAKTLKDLDSKLKYL